MNKVFLLIGLLLLSAGCTTNQAEFEVPELSSAPPLLIENNQHQNDVRTVFTDGITTFKGNYRHLNERLIVKIQQSAIDNGVGSKEPLSLRLLAVRCGGHYVADCEITAEANFKGREMLISSNKFNGYPWDNALEKALDDIANSILFQTVAS